MVKLTESYLVLIDRAMDIQNIKTELKQLVAKGKREDVIDELLKLANSQPEEVCNQIISLAANYHRYQRSLTYGTLSFDSEKRLDNELTMRLLMIIDELEFPSSGEADEAEETAKTETTSVKKPRADLPEEIRKGFQEDYFEAEKTMAEASLKERKASGEVPQRSNILEMEPPQSMEKRKWLLIIPVLFLLMILGYFVYSGDFSTDKSPLWLGTWEFESYPKDNPDNPAKGKIEFSQRRDGYYGYTFEHRILGGEIEMKFTNISFADNGRTMSGQWETEIDGKEIGGDFKFSLGEEGDTFRGWDRKNGQKRNYTAKRIEN